MTFNNFVTVFFFFSSELNDICERDSFNSYISLQQYLNNVEVSYKNFKENHSLKDWRFECQVSIITLTVIFNISYFLSTSVVQN
jgi:hypothetical protein